ncbi:MAG: stage IV sporulation protein A [Ruminococcaceae bacterium]|nr:stage IV sporulation protein A [Oscillospiraceae bacterium]
MTEYSIYQDIRERSHGDVYIGVVGPVRTGKSTFIKKFMDLLVLPNMDDAHIAARARDELPQSAQGKTIMTTEPKFVPNEAVEITLDHNAKLRMRLIDCVGYIVDGASGYMEEDGPRMVSTPWSAEPIPFNQAAEVGTKKVICDHSNIGLVITTDGSITDIDRESYVPAEERVIRELKAINKPFIVLLNSANPQSTKCRELKAHLEQKYDTPVLAVNCRELTGEDIEKIMETVLFEFPVSEIKFNLPGWVMGLDKDHWLSKNFTTAISEEIDSVEKIRSIRSLCEKLSGYDFIQSSRIDGIDLGRGRAVLMLSAPETLFYQVLGEESGFDISDEESLISLIRDLAKTKSEYDKISYALHQVKECGYGVVSPTTDELSLEEPKIIKQGGKYGVRLKASAPSIHMIRANIEAEVSPIVGTEKQSRELIHYLLDEFQTDPTKIWESNIFGKSLYELVNEGVNNKLAKMPTETRQKLATTLERVINEGSGGLICIIL